jgi:hypothetical protein
MIAVKNIVKVPVYNNIVWNAMSTAALPPDEPDGYIDSVEYRCPKCNSLLSRDVYDVLRYLYCYSCKMHGIEIPE